MSLLATYLAYEAEAEIVKQRLAELRDNPELQQEIAFRDKLEALMSEYEKSVADVTLLLDPQGQVTGQIAGKKTRKPRSLKVYKNPNTNEVIETRGGNHKTLKAWKAEYGAETVEGWVEDIIPQAA